VKTYEVQNDTSKTEKHTPMILAPSVVKPNEPFEVTVQVGADIPPSQHCRAPHQVDPSVFLRGWTRV